MSETTFKTEKNTNIQNEDELVIDNIKDEEADAEITPLHYYYGSFALDFPLEVLYDKMKSGEIMHPEFQRKFVWEWKRSSKLLESIMLKLPIPQLFFYADKRGKYLVIDGWQRLKTIHAFMSGTYKDNKGKERTAAIIGINKESPLYQKKFTELSDVEKSDFKRYVIRSVIITPSKDEDDSDSMQEIFARLNTGGLSLQDQEIRNCTCAGPLNDLLITLNKYHSWRQILGKEIEDKRMKDVGLVLRCIALHDKYDNYAKPMQKFLTTYMKQKDLANIKVVEKYFKTTCDLILEKLGPKPFNPKHGVNPSMLDSIFYAFAKHYRDPCPKDITVRFQRLSKNKAYLQSINNATTDKKVIQTRFKLADAKLFG